MHIFFSSSKSGEYFYITQDELKHLRVRRVSIGEVIGLIWEGKLYKAELVKLEPKRAVCKILEILEVEPPPLKVTLYQCITQDIKTMDTIIYKATELGASRVVPVISERSFRNVSATTKRKERWEKIIREAMKQSGRPFPMEVKPPIKLESLQPAEDINILMDNFYDGKDISELNFKEVESVSIVVGPEGGFSQKEGETLRSRGFVSVKLKPFTMRSETAVVVSLGIVMNLAGS